MSFGLPPPPVGIDLTEDRGPLITGISAATWVLAVITVICRVLGRRIRGLRLAVDDWLIIASLVPALIHVLAIAAYAVSRGLGKHVWAAKPDAVYAWSLGLFMAEMSYFLTLTCVKLSILAFYWQTFAIRRSIKWPIYIITGIVCVWAVAVFTVTLLQCFPLRSVWERFNPAHPMAPADYTCRVEPMKFFYGNAIPTIVTDLMMLALPVPYIWGLHLPTPQKVALGGIFLVGIFVTIVSAVRFHYLLRLDLTNPDITWNFVIVGVWSIVEGNIAIVCACLPFLKPVISKISLGHLFATPISFRSRGQSKGSGANSRQKDTCHTWGVDEEKELGTWSTLVKSPSPEGSDIDDDFLTHLTDSTSETEGSTKKLGAVSVKLGAGKPPVAPFRGIMVTTDVRQKLHRVQ